MINTQQYGLVSPVDGVAAVVDSDRETVSVVSSASTDRATFSLNGYARRFPHTQVVEYTSDESLKSSLEEAQQRSAALDFTLMLFDGDLSLRTKRTVARELELLLSKLPVRNYVLDIVLVSPLPNSVDAKEAKAASADYKSVRDVVKTIVDCQERVRQIWNAWHAMRCHEMVAQEGAVQNILAQLIDLGVFRRLVEEGKTQADVNRLQYNIAKSADKRCSTKFVIDFIREYAADLPEGEKVKHAPATIDSVEEDYDVPEAARAAFAADRVVERGEVKRDRALPQIEKIVDLYGSGADTQAKEVLNQLIALQSQSTRDHRHLVKSLCNVAAKCAARGRRDRTLEILTRAFDYPTGVDGVLYLQIGNALRDVERYSESLKCYEKALTLDYGDRYQTIRVEMARTFASSGEYTKALDIYLNEPGLEVLPSAQTSLGTLYRWMGKIRSAYDVYNDVLLGDPFHHSASAGWAETNKQTGRLDKAIRRYKYLLSEKRRIEMERSQRDDNVDEASRRIYTLSLAYLLRLKQRFGESASLLRNMIGKYPRDTEAHLQLARVYLVEGKKSLADEHFGRAQSTPLDAFATTLYQSAFSASVRPNEAHTATIQQLGDNPLATCNQMLTAIDEQDFDTANALITKDIHAIDRLRTDFSLVLNYHAQALRNRSLPYKNDFRLARLAKPRAYPELRDAVLAIADRDFATAIAKERRMCLLVA